jgi:hypothetical protein
VQDPEVGGAVYHAELNMNEARRRVVLSTVGDTVAGDVFYLVSDPAEVWLRVYPAAHEYPFVKFGVDVWHSVETLGDLRERVIIIHNTKESST